MLEIIQKTEDKGSIYSSLNFIFIGDLLFGISRARNTFSFIEGARDTIIEKAWKGDYPKITDGFTITENGFEISKTAK